MRILFLSLFFIQYVFAGDCAPMNLITEENSPFQKIPVYDQDGIGICYAYAAAQLMDYYLIKNGNKEKSVHPLWAALKYAEDSSRPSLSAGIAADAIKAVIRNGNCPYKEVSEGLEKWTDKGKMSESQVISLLETYASKLKKAQDTKKLGNRDTVFSDTEINTVINESIKEQKPFCGAGATPEQLIPELKSLSVMSSTELFGFLVLPTCQNTPPIRNLPTPKYTYISKDALAATTLDDKLDALKGPLGVQYCSKAIRQKDFVGLDRPENKKETNKLRENCDGHESLIVGKKMINNKCHFLLRNSWGSGFHVGTKLWKCLCKEKSTGAYVDNCTAETHNNGKYTVEACWVDGDVFDKNAYSVTSME